MFVIKVVAGISNLCVVTVNNSLITGLKSNGIIR